MRLIKQPPAYTPEFERFWRAYPRRRPNPKALAAAAFQEAVRAGEAPDALIAAAERFAAECRRLETKPEFIPHARTWLSQRRFEDYQGDDATETETADAPEDALYQAMARTVSAAEYRAWIAPLAIAPRGDVAVVTAPSRMHAEWVRQRYADALRRALGRPIEIEVAT